MFAKRILMILSFIAGTACLLSAWRGHDRQLKIGEQIKRVADLQRIYNEKPSAVIAKRDESAGSGASFGSPVYQVNAQYLALNLKDTEREPQPESLIFMAKCLRSENSELVAHCQMLSLTLLSDWVLHRPESEWHSSPVVDEFFRVFKSTHYAKLAGFFERRAIDSEQKYLNQI